MWALAVTLWRSGEKSRPCGMSFDPQFARDTVLPLVQAAYQVFHNPDVDPTLPAGYQKTALLEADPTLLDLITDLSENARSFVQTVAGITTVFGLVGKNTATKTAFVAIRGTQTQTEWLQNLDVDTTGYRPVPDFGDVHMGWMGLYETMRANLAANLPAACAGCDQLIVTGHSLGAALAVLAAPDIAKNISVVPEPKLTTFGGPRPGLHDFVVPFNLLIDSCFRVVNLFDIVPHLPLALPGLPYEHVGVQIAVEFGWFHRPDPPPQLGRLPRWSDQSHQHATCLGRLTIARECRPQDFIFTLRKKNGTAICSAIDQGDGDVAAVSNAINYVDSLGFSYMESVALVIHLVQLDCSGNYSQLVSWANTPWSLRGMT